MSWIGDITAFESYLDYVNSHFSNIPLLNLYAKYANFLQVDFKNRGTSVFSEYPDFWEIVVIWAVGLNLLGAIVKYGIMALYPEWTKDQLSDEKKTKRLNEMNANVAAIVHHILVSTSSMYLIYKDMTRTGTINYTREHGYLFAISQGYIIGDFIVYAIPHRDKAMCVHHLLFLLISLGFIYNYREYPAYFLRYVPYSYICETSGIFFIANQFLSQAGIKNIFCSIFKFCFAFFFWLFRIVSLPLVFLTMLYAPWKVSPNNFVRQPEYNILCILVYPFLCMQFFWMFCIIQSALKSNKDKDMKPKDKKLKDDPKTQ